MLRSLHLKGVGPAPELSLDLAPRLNLLTGDNGLGKSFVLDIAWWALTKTWSGQPAWPREETGIAPEIEYEFLGRRASSGGAIASNALVRAPTTSRKVNGQSPRTV